MRNNEAPTVSTRSSPGVKRRRGRSCHPDRAVRLFHDRAQWDVYHRKDNGHPFLNIPGTASGTSHYTDLLDCTCQRRQFMRRGPDTACTHTRAARIWYTAVRLGQVAAHPKGPYHHLAPGDRAYFEAQDLVVARVADSLLTQYDAGTSQPIDWDIPASQDDGLQAELTRDAAAARQVRQSALVDPDADPVTDTRPPDERP